MIRVLVADDQAMVRAGLSSVLAGEDDMTVVAQAADGEAAVRKAREHSPDVILMDIRMPVLDGIAATRRILAGGVPSRVLVLTTFDLDEYVFEALRAGASGFLLKDATAEALVDAVRTLSAGAALLDPAVTRLVIDCFTTGRAPAPERTAALGRLTMREREVLALIARGLSNAEIADELVVTAATSKTHVSNVLSKLGVRDRVHAVILAYECGVAG